MSNNCQGRIRFIDAQISGDAAVGPTIALMKRVQGYLYETYSVRLKWERHLNELAQFLQTHERWPSQRSQDKAERSLAYWFRRTGTAFKRGALAAEQLQMLSRSHELLRHRVASWMDPASAWHHRCQQLKAHIEEFGELPHARHNTKWGKKLARWLNHVRARMLSKTMPSEQLALVKEVHPLASQLVESWKTGEGSWMSSCSKLEAFICKHGRLPESRYSGGEGNLYRWLNKQCYQYDALRPERARRLANVSSSVAERIKLQQDSVSKWRACFWELDLFVRRTCRLPARESTKSKERSLAQWFHHQLVSSRKLSAHQLACLRTSDPLISFELRKFSARRAVPAASRHFHERCRELTMFMNTHQHLPNTNSANTSEVSLAKWMRRQLRCVHEMTAEDEHALRSTHAAVSAEMGSDSLTTGWKQRLADLSRFLKEHGRLPLVSHGGTERHLARWLARQKSSLGRFSDQQLIELKTTHPLVEERVATWLDPLCSWRLKCNMVAAYMQEHGQMPKMVNCDREETMLHTWIASQSHAYRRGTLSSEQILNLTSAHPLLCERVKCWSSKRLLHDHKYVLRS
eukprot:TRINITY_DN90158_c0_g1_i1.p1 TRINITY_DN90158_c0_g1~~TRINITY_DN90158_c0_g1_i1.p1  ORF type:complete len:627 (-),score=75.17 TRINITY_DN90158_c0_g1_i1:342-2066(-)